jgi:uncharacterized membrane protein
MRRLKASDVQFAIIGIYFRDVRAREIGYFFGLGMLQMCKRFGYDYSRTARVEKDWTRTRCHYA